MDMRNRSYNKEEKRQLCKNKISQLIAYINGYRQVEYAQLKCSYVCINSNMFRGYLHPSPVVDLIVGNISRGRLQKGDVYSEKLSYRYLFDDIDRLVRIENIHKGKVAYVEDLFYTSNSRIGITSNNGKVHSICEEIFESGHIVSVAIMLYYEMDGGHICHLNWEEYAYDENGLHFCDFVANFTPGSNPFTFSQYAFCVQDGLLKSYTNRAGNQYIITKKRDAQGKGFYFP